MSGVLAEGKADVNDQPNQLTDLVGVHDIAQLLHVKDTTVSGWQTRRLTTNFPEPDLQLPNKPLWYRQRIVDWYTNWIPLKSHKKVGYLTDTTE